MSTINPFKRPFVLSFAPEAEPGGDPAPTPDPQPPAPTPDPAPAGGEPTPQPTPDPAPGEPDPAGGSPETFSKEYVEKLRKEAAGYREKAKNDAAAAAETARTELAQSIGKALGLIKDDEKPDPEALVAQAQADRQKAIDEANSHRRDLAVLRNADKHDANTDELLDSRSFQTKLAALDPSDDDFASQVDALVKETVDSNPGKFKRVQAAGSSGGGTHSGEGDTTPPGDKSIDDIREERRKRRGLS